MSRSNPYRTTFKWDEKAEMMYEVGSNYFEETPQGPAVISDDVGAGVNGLRHMPSGKMMDSKSAHRRETKARGLEEVGNQTDFASQKVAHKPGEYGEMVKAAAEQIQGNWNGTADWLKHQERK